MVALFLWLVYAQSLPLCVPDQHLCRCLVSYTRLLLFFLTHHYHVVLAAALSTELLILLVGLAPHTHQLYCELSLILLAGSLNLGYGLSMLNLLLLGLIDMCHELIMLDVGVTHVV